MAEPSPGTGPAPDATTGVPRWVKVFVLLGAVVVALAVIAMLAGHGPGDRGPGGHLGTAEAHPPVAAEHHP